MPRLHSLPRDVKQSLQFYGFRGFWVATALTGFSAIFAPAYLYGVAVVAILGGAAGIVGWLAPERRAHRRTLVFVSKGGTCRDPMAKVIMEELLADRQPSIRVIAAALSDPSDKTASKAARYVVRQETGSDLLHDHCPRQLDRSLVREADLILTMDEYQASEIQKNHDSYRERVYSLLGFLGSSGDIVDPWEGPDAMDDATIERYRATYHRLHDLLSKNVDRIYSKVIA